VHPKGWILKEDVGHMRPNKHVGTTAARPSFCDLTGKQTSRSSLRDMRRGFTCRKWTSSAGQREGYAKTEHTKE
jgi:hypothetical protein